MSESNFYVRLDVSPTATHDEIRSAYRAKAAAYHPDISTAADADARMAMINEAFTTLRDPVRRAAYDRLLLRVARRTIVAGGQAGGTSGATAAAERWTRRREEFVRRAAALKPHRVPALPANRAVTERNLSTRIAFGVAGSVMVAVAVIMMMSGANSDDASLAPKAALQRAKIALHHARERGALGALVAIRDGYDSGTVDSQGTCSERTFVRIAGDVSIVTSDGARYRARDRNMMLGQAESWRTGDRVIVCRSGTEASIANATSYAWVAATYDQTKGSETVLCGPSVIRQIGDHGSGVELADGTSYVIDPRSVAQYATADWATGNHVVLCRSGSSASIENLSTAAKVQASFNGNPPPVHAHRNCTSTTVSDARASANRRQAHHRERVVVCVTSSRIPQTGNKVAFADKW